MAKHHDLTSLQPLDGELQVLCTFDYEPGEAVFVTGVAINGYDVNAAVFDPKVVARWERDILAERKAEEADERALAGVEA